LTQPADGVVDRLVLEVDARVKQSAVSLPGWLEKLATIAAGAVAALTALTYASAATADASIKAARAAGITVEEYTALAYAADLAGVSTEAIAMASRTVALTLSAAAAGSAEAAAAYEALGIDAAKATEEGLTFAELLPQIIDGLKAIPEPTRRTAIAMKLLGEQGARMATLIEGGGDALRYAMIEAERFGVVISEEAAVASEDLNDSTTRLMARVKGLALRFGLDLVPAADRVVDALGEVMDAASPHIIAALEVAADGLTMAIDAMLTPLGRLLTLLGSGGLLGLVLMNTTRIAALASKIPLVGQALAALVPAFGAATLAAGPWILAIIAIGFAVDDLRAYMQGAESAIGSLATAMGADSQLYAALSSVGDIVTSIADAFHAAFGWARQLDAQIAQMDIPILSTMARAAGYEGPATTGDGAPSAPPPAVGRGFDNLAVGLQAIRYPGALLTDPEAVFRAARSRVDELERQRTTAMGGTVATVQTNNVAIRVDGARDPSATAREVARQFEQYLNEAQSQVEGGVR